MLSHILGRHELLVSGHHFVARQRIFHHFRFHNGYAETGHPVLFDRILKSTYPQRNQIAFDLIVEVVVRLGIGAFQP